MRRLVFLIPVALIGPPVHGITPYQACMDMADITRTNCETAAQNDYKNAQAKDLTVYNDCISPFSTTTRSLGQCIRDAIAACGADNACLTTKRNQCNVNYLGDGTAYNLGICKDDQLNSDNLAGQLEATTLSGCITTWTNTVNDVCSTKSNESPIVIDPTGEGFWLTDKQHGVQFRRGPDSPLQQMSWTDPAHHNAWLVKPNADGSVTSLSANLFGNLSPQPPSSDPNGYLALAYLAEQNDCGKIDRLDSTTCPAVWKQLRLWQDANQDGAAQPGELHTLEALGVHGISLKYRENKYVDEYGNQFRYTSKIYDEAGDENERCYRCVLDPLTDTRQLARMRVTLLSISTLNATGASKLRVQTHF